MITNNDVVVIEHLTLSKYELDICELIANNTVETWQSNRTPEAKLRDTCLGKFAEKALKQFFSNGCHDNLNPYIAFYDDFRVDEFKFHNSIDFLFSNRIHHLLSAQRFIQDSLSGQNSKLNTEQREKFKVGKVGVGEIKATRIADRLMTDGQVNISGILRDDFLTYPYFTRKSTISNNREYFAKYSSEKNLTQQEILEIEKSALCDWYFRVYIKENPNNIANCDAYIVGALPGVDFVNKFNIKKMVQNNKSESAVYLSVPLSQGVPIMDFKKEHIPSTPFPNHLTAYAQGEKIVNDILLKQKTKP